MLSPRSKSNTNAASYVRFRTDVKFICTLNLIRDGLRERGENFLDIEFIKPRKYYSLFLDNVFAFNRRK
jgi:hypothetical protein